MLWVYLTIFAVLNIYCLIYFHQMNNELRKEIAVTKEWCKNIIEEIVEKERKIDESLLKVIDNINDNRYTPDIADILSEDNMREFQRRAYFNMKKEQKDITSQIMDIKNEHSDLVLNLEDQIENFPGE